MTGVPVFQAEFHHEVLPFWAKLAGDGRIDFVLTLDHHTDILPAFSRMDRKPEIRRENVNEAVRLLRHDEHIDWALRAGIIGRSVIISHECFTTPAHPAMKVILPGEWPESRKVLDSAPEAYDAAKRVLESDFLKKALAGTDLSGKYILDIDLDNFLCERALHPADPSFFLNLAENAAGISISMERDWQRLLRLKGENFTSDDAFRELKSMFRKNGT